MIDIKKYLGKADIIVKNVTKEEIVVFIKETNEEKTIKVKELEKYLFICVLDFINDQK